jgi:hypothetical protein
LTGPVLVWRSGIVRVKRSITTIFEEHRTN